VLGSQFRRLREARGITTAEASRRIGGSADRRIGGSADRRIGGSADRRIGGSATRIALLEHGRDLLAETDLEGLLTVYGVSDAGERRQRLDLAAQAGQSGWWHRYQDVLPAWFQAYVGLEETAEAIVSHDAQIVPGLLQTDEYAAAVIGLGSSSAREAQRLVSARRQRQRRLASGGLRLRVVIDELALRRPVGSPQVMRDQLRTLLGAAARPGITVQVSIYPGHYSVPGSFPSCTSPPPPTCPTWSVSSS
jgi:transcriptional regulator with XRE-family HTH domain